MVYSCLRKQTFAQNMKNKNQINVIILSLSSLTLIDKLGKTFCKEKYTFNTKCKLFSVYLLSIYIYIVI